MPRSSYSLTDRERMGGLARNLKYRATIQRLSKTVSTGNAPGYYDDGPPIEETYTDLTTVWCYIPPRTSMTQYIAAIRGQNQDATPSHEIIVRWESVRNLGAAYTLGFDSGFEVVRKMNPIKADFFLFIKSGTDYRGRRFQVLETGFDERNHEYLILRCKEVEEVGTGYQP